MPAPAPRTTKVLAAYFRLLGYTQEEIGKQVRRGSRTIRTWEAADDWGELCAEAQAIYLKDVIAAARKSVIDQIKGGDGDLGFKVLERNELGFEPAPQRLKIGVEQDEADAIDEEMTGQITEMETRYHVNGSTPRLTE